MEIYERIKELRKKTLKMSQTAFGNRLGVNRDTINNIELNRLKKPEQKLSLYKLICSEFNVSEEWLLNGTGDMFTSNESEYSTMIDQIMHGENEFAKNIFKTFAPVSYTHLFCSVLTLFKIRDPQGRTVIIHIRNIRLH